MHSVAQRTALMLPFLCLVACVAGSDAADDLEIRGSGATLDANADVLDRLKMLPGVASVTETSAGGARGFTFTIEQPIDHTNPSVGTFTMRVLLRHRSETAPTVLSYTGYSLFSRTPTDSEPSAMLGANSVSVEHRFFSASTPMAGANGEPPPEAWQYATVKQAAGDFHHLIETLKQIYTGPWISTGASKGGQTAVYHYRYYPQDLAGVVAYVAPHSYGSNDPRYDNFLEYVGDKACRDKVVALQRDALMRRSELFPRFQQQTSAMGLTFDAIGIDAAYEHIIQEFRIAFWQYGMPSCASLPQPGSANVFSVITGAVPLNLSADQNIRSVKQFETYYYQAAVELGQYGPVEKHLEDLLQHPGTYTMEKYAPDVPSKNFDPSTMIDVGKWVKTEAEHIIFVYGENDPWTAGAFEVDPSRDIHAFVVPGSNHGATLSNSRLPQASRDLASQILKKWTGATPQPLHMGPEEPAAGTEEPFAHLPPRQLLR